MQNPNAIIVEVAGRSWCVFGDPTNEHHVLAMSTLELLGGVNESVAEGTYTFNVEIVEDQLFATLDPM